jgi:hypothetical protein
MKAVDDPSAPRALSVKQLTLRNNQLADTRPWRHEDLGEVTVPMLRMVASDRLGRCLDADVRRRVTGDAIDVWEEA